MSVLEATQVPFCSNPLKVRASLLQTLANPRIPLSFPRVALVALLLMNIGTFVDNVGIAYDAYSQPAPGAKKSKRRDHAGLGAVGYLL